MVIATPAALAKLSELLAEHPEDPVVRLTIIDRDDDRIVFGITLESAARPDDIVQETGGLTIATEARSAARMDGVTLDYREPGGFRFIHPEPPPPKEEPPFSLFNLH
ncbi:MAG: iron-sulfur cluster biosynthesis family protein [Nitrospirota bacterium]